MSMTPNDIAGIGIQETMEHQPQSSKWPSWVVPVLIALGLNAGAIIYSWGAMATRVDDMQTYFSQRMSAMELDIRELTHATRGPKQ